MRFLKRPEIKIPTTFLALSLLWVLFSDRLLLRSGAVSDLNALTALQTAKGICYVIAVTVLIYLMVKRSNRKLLKSREEYKDLFENVPDPLFFYNPETSAILNVNRAATEVYGFSRSDFMKKTIDDIRMHSNGKESWLSVSGYDIRRHITRNGDVIYCQETTRTVVVYDQQLCLLSAHNITELEDAKQQLENRERQLQIVLNSITDGYFILSEELIVRKANDYFTRLVEKKSSTDIEGKPLLDLFPSIADSYAYQQYQHAITNGRSAHFENFYEQKSLWFRIAVYPCEGGIFVFFRDITKEKKIELQNASNTQNLLALINNTQHLIWSIDDQFRYFTYNEPYKTSYQSIFNDTLWIGKTALNTSIGSAHIATWTRLYQRALDGEKFSVDMEYTLGNQVHYTTTSFNPIYNNDRQVIGVGCFLQDITERKLYQQRIEEQNQHLKNLAFITSHNVRVPLANILGLVEVLDKDDPLSESNVHIIDHLKTSAQELDKTIINLIRETSRIQQP